MVYTRVMLACAFRSVLIQRLGIDPVELQGNAKLSELGLDFVGLLELEHILEQRFEIRPGAHILSSSFTVDESIDWLERMVDARLFDSKDAYISEGAD
jgi:hypothetical protein